MGDRILDQLIWCLRGEFIKGIDDHSSSEYVRLFKQAALNSRVPMLEKAGSVVMDAMDRTLLQEKFCGVLIFSWVGPPADFLFTISMLCFIGCRYILLSL